MATTQIEPERIRRSNDADPNGDGRYVLYWMQASQRAQHNPALEFAVQQANQHDVTLVVAAVVIADYPEASGETLRLHARWDRPGAPRRRTPGSDGGRALR